MSVRLRLTLLYTAILAVTLVAFALGVYGLLARNLTHELDDSLTVDASQALRLETRLGREQGGHPVRIFQVPMQLPGNNVTELRLASLSGDSIQLVDSSGVVRGQSDNLIADGHGLPVPPANLRSDTFERVNVNGRSYRVLIEPIPLVNGAFGFLEVARPLTEAEHTLLQLRLILALGVVGALLLAGVAGWGMATFSLQPINRLTRAAQEIGEAQDFSRRVPYTGPRDELGRLAGTFNGMLGRLQAAYARVQTSLESQRRFVADASHELRTPLTTIRGNVELLMLDDQDETLERREALHDIASEAERMSRLVTNLLVLARADAGLHLQRSLVSMRPLVEEVYRQAHYIGGDVALELGELPEATVFGSADHLKQLLLILLDNAIKYTPAGGTIRLSGERFEAPKGAMTAGELRLSVSDTGPGIPAEDQARIFDRFYRVDASRHGEAAGLGLAIARWIATEHEGRLSVESTPGNGSTFTIALPLRPDPLPLPLPAPQAEPAGSRPTSGVAVGGTLPTG